jgi:hypothetical protein
VGRGEAHAKARRHEEWKRGRLEEWGGIFDLWLRELEAPATLVLLRVK